MVHSSAHPHEVDRQGDSALRAAQRSTMADGTILRGSSSLNPAAERLVPSTLF